MVLLSPSIIEPISEMKVQNLRNQNPRIRAGEVLIALAISARTNPLAELAMTKIGELANCQAHSSTIIHPEDASVLRKLKINVTQEPVSSTRKITVR